MIDYLKLKFHWTQDIIINIDWNSHHSYIKSFPLSQKIQFIKHIYKWTPRNKKLYQISYQECNLPKCPLYGHPQEDNNHPYKCTHPMMREAQMESIQKLRQSLQKIQTHPIITEIIAHHIKKWMRTEDPDIVHRLNTKNTHTLLQKALK